ncbi:MAG: c-type cytochrome [Ottowia sp.]|nr:c-type cytochrome [Ottowia sp.]
MYKTRLLAWATALLALGSSAALSAPADMERGKELAQACVACHGAEGAGMATGGFPRLNILTSGHMVKQLQDVKSGTRESAVMMPFVAGMDEQQMRDVSAWFAAQTAAPPAPPEADAELMALGEKLASRGDWDRYIPACHSCHGPKNQGVGDAFPALAGQHAGYIESQLNAWRNGSRDNDPLQLMLAVAERMNDTDVRAVAAWLAAQPADGDDKP